MKSDENAVVGVVCEYDPFHRGHARHFARIRERLPGAAIVCVMSGPFTQRGAAALFAPAFRAERALRAGADAVFELPCAFAVREAEHFALGGASVLQRLGFVTHLSFGCEAEEIAPLRQAAALMEAQPAPWREALRRARQDGRSFAAAQGAALAALLPDAPEGTFARPNNILALSYLRALKRLGANLIPLPVHRPGDYRAETLADAAPESPSASAVRAAWLAGERAAAAVACGYPLPDGPACRPDALDLPLLYRLRGSAPEQLAALPDCTEGLENRLFSAARETVTRAALIERLKTKRYPYARLSRLCCHALLDVSRRLLEDTPLPPYARLLGFRKQSEPLLARLSQSRIPVVAKAADGPLSDPCYQLDVRAYDAWALGAGLPAGLMLRTPPVILAD